MTHRSTPTPDPSPHGGGERKPILLARIVAAHGIKGAVKLVIFASQPADLEKYSELRTGDGRTFKITQLKLAKDHHIATLKDVGNRNAAESFRGQDVFVDRSQLPALPDGEFYVSDLIGRPVMAGDAPLGTIAGIQNFGAGDLLELETGLLVPLRFVTETQPAVKVSLPHGYLDAAGKPDDN